MTGPLGFTVAIPDTWMELDVDPRTRDSRIRSLVEQRVRDVPELWEQRAALTRLLRRQARDAHEAGAVYCACFVMPAGETVIPGSMSLSILPPPPGGGAADAIAEALPTKEANGPGDTWMTRAMVEHPGTGRVPRSQGVTDVELPGGRGWIRTIVMQTFLPLGDGRVLMIGCASPALDLVEPLLELFDEVSANVRLIGAPEAIRESP
jgi:hypothetical protein